MSDEAAVDQLVDGVLAEYGQLDALIHAGFHGVCAVPKLPAFGDERSLSPYQGALVWRKHLLQSDHTRGLVRTCRKDNMAHFLHKVWPSDEGQDIAEYAIMLAVILALGVGAIKAIGVNATFVFSSVGSSIQ